MKAEECMGCGPQQTNGEVCEGCGKPLSEEASRKFYEGDDEDE